MQDCKFVQYGKFWIAGIAAQHVYRYHTALSKNHTGTHIFNENFTCSEILHVFGGSRNYAKNFCFARIVALYLDLVRVIPQNDLATLALAFADRPKKIHGNPGQQRAAWDLEKTLLWTLCRYFDYFRNEARTPRRPEPPSAEFTMISPIVCFANLGRLRSSNICEKFKLILQLLCVIFAKRLGNMGEKRLQITNSRESGGENLSVLYIHCINVSPALNCYNSRFNIFWTGPTHSRLCAVFPLSL